MPDQSDEPHFQKYNDLFHKHLEHVDELAQVVLKGHLIIENALDNVIELIFFHPKHLEECRLGFAQKTHIARAFCLRKDENNVWKLILTLNALRNKIAHNLLDDQQNSKMAKLRTMYFDELGTKPSIDEQNTMADHVVAFYAAAMCAGFLSSYEQDLQAFRKLVGGMDAILNPDAARASP